MFHYVPLHTSPVGLSLGYEAGMLPVTESISDRLLRLPMYAGLEPMGGRRSDRDDQLHSSRTQRGNRADERDAAGTYRRLRA